MSRAELPELNTDLLAQILTWSALDEKNLRDRFPSLEAWGVWNQSSWGLAVRNGVCRTAYCQAGQAAVQSGYAFSWDYEKVPVEEIGNSALTEGVHADRYGRVLASEESYVYPVKRVLNKKGRWVEEPDTDKPAEFTSDVGQRALGLTSKEADAYFAGGNSLHSLVRFAKMFAKVRGVTLDLPSEIDEMILDSEVNRMIENYDWFYAGYKIAA
jgi:hypothetical protein